MSDAELLRAARRDPDAFVAVCERHIGPLRAWLRRETHDDHVAAELVAETLATAWRARGRYRDPGTGSARPWLFGIARNLLRRYWQAGAVDRRGRARLALRVEVASAEDPFADVDARLTANGSGGSLRAALASLPAEQRDALTLRVIDELEYDEIAAELAVAPTTARTRVFRALTTLRARMGGGPD